MRTRASARRMSSRSCPLRPEDMERARRAAAAIGAASERSGCRCSCTRRPSVGRRSTGVGDARSSRGGWRRASSLLTTGRPYCMQTAGGVILGARSPLIAFNVNLRGSLSVAREVAAVVRERGGGFPGVRALGLDLPRAGLVQVSMNVEDWEAAALHDIVDRISAEADRARCGGRRLGARRADARRRAPRLRRRSSADRRLRCLAGSRASTCSTVADAREVVLRARRRRGGDDVDAERAHERRGGVRAMPAARSQPLTRPWSGRRMIEIGL